jgi:hypothetical protein
VWKEALKEWNMQQSQQVLEWQVEAALQKCREYLRMLLEDRFGPLPEALRQKIDTSEDMEGLQQAFRQALRLQRLEDLQL